MKLCLFAGMAALAWAQSSTTRTFTPDVNGQMVEGISSTAKDGERTLRATSLNGGKIPVEDSHEKILRDDASGKTIERIVRRFDQTGASASSERILIEERKFPGGGSHVEQTTWASDFNGGMAKIEQQSSDTRVSGSSTTTETAISRPSGNGGFEVAEKRSLVKDTSNGKETSQETVQRRGGDNQFADAVREVRVVEKTPTETKESTAVYEAGLTSKLELARQSVSVSSKRPDGSEVTQTNLYARTTDGRAQEPGPPALMEQQIQEKRKAADGSVVETTSVRRPSISDSNKLGSAQKVSETVCTGKCQ